MSIVFNEVITGGEKFNFIGFIIFHLLSLVIYKNKKNVGKHQIFIYNLRK